jgi:signal transduction histidine kinase
MVKEGTVDSGICPVCSRERHHPAKVESGLRTHKIPLELVIAGHARAEEISRLKTRIEMLVHALQKQRDFTTHLLAVLEEERSAVAREISDELGQMLATLQLNVSLLTREYPDQAKLVARSQVMEQLISSSVMSVQQISSALRPSTLDLLGLADAMEWQARKFRDQTGIPCKTTILLSKNEVDRNVATAVYRIFQEALDLFTRHSGESGIRMYLVERKRWLTLTVHDAGGGRIDHERNGQESHAISVIRERAEAFGGRLRFRSSPERGSALFVRMPAEAKEDGNDTHEKDTRCR